MDEEMEEHGNWQSFLKVERKLEWNEFTKSSSLRVVKFTNTRQGLYWSGILGSKGRLYKIICTYSMYRNNSFGCSPYSSKRMCIYQLDIKLTDLYGELNEEVLVEQPSGHLHKGHEHKVYKLKKKPLYLSKHHVFGTAVEAYFMKEGFENVTINILCWWGQVKKENFDISLHVDDLVFSVNDEFNVP